jgi:acyl-CoA thioesterase
VTSEFTTKEKQLAEEVGVKLFERDIVANVLGIKLDQIAPGYASMSMSVRNDMLNGLGICHGGMTYTLADTAFAYACNSRNEKTVALSCTISYAVSVYEGDTLMAVAEEQVLNGRTGIYDVVVTNRLGEKVAFFRGNSYKTSQNIF